MKRQCAWCLKVFNVYKDKWEHGPAQKLGKMVCCPQCKQKQLEIQKKAA